MSKDYEELLQGEDTVILDESGKPRELALKFLNKKGKFDVKEFASFYERFEALKGASLSQHSQITLGLENLFDGMESSKAEGARNHHLSLYGNNLLTFSRAKTKDLASLVWDSNKKALADYVLSTPTFEGKDSEYEATRKDFESSREELEALQKDPKKYVESKMEKLDDDTKAFFAPFVGKMVQEEAAILHDKAIRTVGEYGFPKFASQNVEAAWGNAEKDKEDKKAQKQATQLTMILSQVAYESYQAKKQADEEEAKREEAEKGKAAA